MKKLAILTGYQAMPPYFSLGYHYSKWEKISTDSIIDKIDSFIYHNIPVDVLWLDIDHTDDRRYFTFNNDFSDIDRLTSKAEKE